MTKPKPSFDVRSAEPVLRYVGPGTVANVPDTDLSANALARIAWVRAGDRPSTPDDVAPEAIAALCDELIATGQYAKETPTNG